MVSSMVKILTTTNPLFKDREKQFTSLFSSTPPQFLLMIHLVVFSTGHCQQKFHYQQPPPLLLFSMFHNFHPVPTITSRGFPINPVNNKRRRLSFNYRRNCRLKNSNESNSRARTKFTNEFYLVSKEKDANQQQRGPL